MKWTHPEGRVHFLVDSSYTGGVEDPCEFPTEADQRHRESTAGYKLLTLERPVYRDCPSCLW